MPADIGNERLVYLASTHWLKYVFNVLKNHFLIAIALMLLWLSTVSILSFVAIGIFFCASLLALYAHHNLFHKIMSESMYDIFVTSERVIYFDDNLFISNNEHEIPLHRIASIEAKQQGVLQNILNVGTIWVDTGGSTVDLKRTIPNVYNPEALCEQIMQLVHSEVAHES